MPVELVLEGPRNKRSVLFKGNLVGLRHEFVLLRATGWDDQYTAREGSWSCPKVLGTYLSCFLTVFMTYFNLT